MKTNQGNNEQVLRDLVNQVFQSPEFCQGLQAAIRTTTSPGSNSLVTSNDMAPITLSTQYTNGPQTSDNPRTNMQKEVRRLFPSARRPLDSSATATSVNV